MVGKGSAVNRSMVGEESTITWLVLGVWLCLRVWV